jgi:hypothetical protein
MLFIVTQKGDLPAAVMINWFDLLRESQCFSNQRSVRLLDLSLILGACTVRILEPDPADNPSDVGSDFSQIHISP